MEITYSVIKKLCSRSEKDMNNSFNIIFSKYKNLVYYVSYDILKNSSDAEEIVDETFMKMYENRSKFMNENSLKYFLLVTSKNLSINRYKKMKEHLEYSDDIIGRNDEDDVSIYLEKFKDILYEEEYRYLVLHLIYDFSFREIAKFSNLTTSQVSSKYRRALEKLRDFYGGK